MASLDRAPCCYPLSSNTIVPFLIEVILKGTYWTDQWSLLLFMEDGVDMEWISIQLALLSHWIGPCAEATVLAPAEGHARRRWPRARTGRRGGSRERARRRWRRPRARRRQPRRGLVGESMALRACSYGCIRVFLALSLLLLAVEFAAYLQGWHLEEVALLLAVDGLFAASYVGWMRLRLNYLAPPL
uniref:Uncharacterized protein n=1 Tax=Oryza glumipatula TaxID=40148 RepID=A0A0E0BBA8_9ORYZ